MYARLILCVLVAACWQLEVLGTLASLLLATVSYLVTGGNYTLYLIYHTAARDARGAWRYLRLLATVWYYEKLDLTVPGVFERTVRRHPHRVCLHFEDQSWTFQQLDEFSNRVANFLHLRGFVHGDSVALFMENRPEYIGLWLGCTKVGVVPALINYNLRGQSLLHSIHSAYCTALIFGAELSAAVSDIARELGTEFRLMRSGRCPGGLRLPLAEDLDRELASQQATEVPEAVRTRLSFRDKLLFIYTSGTTGLPKAAVVKNSR